jgi:2-polyprenyl-6-methoxyphenol hydroxylase-like FAD-dependent oxidoreductase
VIIIGAGPGGLTAAVALSRVGVPVAVFEQAPELKEVGAGLGIGGPSLKALQRIGVGQALLEAGARVEWHEVYSWRGRQLARLPMGEIFDQYGTPTISVLRSDLQTALLEAVPDGVVSLGARCVGVEQDETGVTARFEDGREERGTVLVGADGARSVVRSGILRDEEPRHTGVTGWRSVVPAPSEDFHPETVMNFLGRGRLMATFPCGRDLVYWAVATTSEPAGGDDPETVKQAISSVLEGSPEYLRALIDAAPSETILRTELQDRDPADTWIDGRIALLGDAAHLTSPFVGQGAGIAMEDAVTLARELALTARLEDARMIAAALESYQDKRIERASATVLNARKRGKLLTLGNPVACLMRNAALRYMPRGAVTKGLAASIDYSV